ncbi:hypothetical protein EGH21_18995 [Halomicroarcula sp. F13]|uniref:Uncharacterized protein n=1 Tax=Haloarcula rubra TaxID=2487747 RepID=A0AAW4PV06_9EURY|nr:hypothetical protein [Halomicroarcula rubra]MBX0325120.1 hypothetical protein [Halomicroarcula rubra]
MPHETTARLAEYAHNNVNDALRTIAVVYEGDCEVLYLRDDLKGEYTAAEYKSVVDSFRVVPELTSDMTSEAPLGSKQCLIHYHEKAFVFQFPHEACHSLLLSVEPTVGSRLQSFINGCQQRL